MYWWIVWSTCLNLWVWFNFVCLCVHKLYDDWMFSLSLLSCCGIDLGFRLNDQKPKFWSRFCATLCPRKLNKEMVPTILESPQNIWKINYLIFELIKSILKLSCTALNCTVSEIFNQVTNWSVSEKENFNNQIIQWLQRILILT